MTKTDFWFPLLAAAVLIGVVGIIAYVGPNSAIRDECAAKGGVLVDGTVCVRRDAIIFAK